MGYAAHSPLRCRLSTGHAVHIAVRRPGEPLHAVCGQVRNPADLRLCPDNSEASCRHCQKCREYADRGGRRARRSGGYRYHQHARVAQSFGGEEAKLMAQIFTAVHRGRDLSVLSRHPRLPGLALKLGRMLRRSESAVQAATARGEDPNKPVRIHTCGQCGKSAARHEEFYGNDGFAYICADGGRATGLPRKVG